MFTVGKYQRREPDKGVELTCTNLVQLLLEPVNSSSVASSFLGVAQ